MSEVIAEDQEEAPVKEAPKSKPPAALMQDTLASMQISLAKLVRQDQKDRDLGMLMADCRDTMTEAVGELHTQLTDVLALLDRLTQAATTRAPQPERAWSKRDLQIGLAGCGLGLLLCGVLWWAVPAARSQYEQLATGVDAVLVQHYGMLPKPVQEGVTAAYDRAAFRKPSTAVKGAK